VVVIKTESIHQTRIAVNEIDKIWAMLRALQPTGPLVNSEFYPGWLTHWQEQNQRRDGQEVANALRYVGNTGLKVSSKPVSV